MFIDNLTLAGMAIAASYLLLPLLFGRETLRVEEDLAPAKAPTKQRPRPSVRPTDQCPSV